MIFWVRGIASLSPTLITRAHGTLSWQVELSPGVAMPLFWAKYSLFKVKTSHSEFPNQVSYIYIPMLNKKNHPPGCTATYFKYWRMNSSDELIIMSRADNAHFNRKLDNDGYLGLWFMRIVFVSGIVLHLWSPILYVHICCSNIAICLEISVPFTVHHFSFTYYV